MRGTKPGGDWESLAVVAILALAVLAASCEAEDDGMDPTPFLGGWLPCLDQACTTVSFEGVAFLEDEWFQRIYPLEDEQPPETALEGEFNWDMRECCWRTTADEIIIDYDDYYQVFKPRLLNDRQLQLEWVVTRRYDDEEELDVEVVCEEGTLKESFGEWTHGDCWSPHWAPIGRAIRVLTPEEAAALPLKSSLE